MWSNLILGAWIFVAPWVLGSDGLLVRALDHAVGVTAAMVALLAALAALPPLRYVHTALGMWLIATPFALGYPRGAAMLNDLVAGFGLVVFSLLTPYARRGRVT